MPNSRRRKFSVRNGVTVRKPSKAQDDVQTSSPVSPDPANKTTVGNMVVKSKNKNSKCKIKMHPDSSKNSNKEDLISKCETSTLAVTANERSNDAVDKIATASSSNIDLFNIMYASEEPATPWKGYWEKKTIEDNETSPKRATRPASRGRAPVKREKHPRQHRIKVRNPKSWVGIGIIDTQNKSDDIQKLTFSTGTEAIDWSSESEVHVENLTNVTETIEDDERQSDHSSDDMCRICHGGDSLSQELGQLISACACRGTVGRVHVKCLERWLTESGKSRCELCGTRYATRRVHRYGVPRALIMWILSQNAKQLMVDSLGIMLMSPLAVLAAWLSGRTLAGLMMQDAHTTPWPLASTFVLACMTLVCYYCWIVSAATRHALGWWIWYRSQYEVRLQLLDTDE